MDIDFTTKIRATRVFHYNNDANSTAKAPSQKTFESDRGRILNSAAIRRLQQKTQVFPLERNAAVRSRLTHSLEVQQVGRYITQLIFDNLSEQQLKTYNLTHLERQFESIVEMSCLMHDIGNPPFGHFGEQAINDWFTRNLASLTPQDSNAQTRLELPPKIHRDLTNFEGNAQAIRLVHTLLGLNLTYTQVSGIFKYTRRGDENKPNKDEPFSYLKKKVGFYLSEYRYVESMKQELCIASGCRSPFSYIMEAADDISYGIADIEDAVEKGILDIAQLTNILDQEYRKVASENSLENQDEMKHIVDKAVSYASKSDNCNDSNFFIAIRVGINKRLPQHACKEFINNIDAVFNGSFNRALIEDQSVSHALVKTLKNVALKYAFCDPEVEKRELQGYQIITGLLEAYKPLLLLSREQFENIEDAPLYERRLHKKLPNKHLQAYRIALDTLASEKEQSKQIPYLPLELADDVWEFYFRVRLIQDYISGMTDQFAFDEYRAFQVIDNF